MRHDYDEATVAAYLARELPPAGLEAFEAHLLGCDRCWREIEAGRSGRALVERAREPVPDRVRHRVLAAVEAQAAMRPPTSRVPRRPAPWSWAARLPRPRLLVAMAGTAVVVLVASVAVSIGFALGRAGGDAGPPAQIAAAVADYRSETLPGELMPHDAAPDLSAVGMSVAGAGGGVLGAQEVTGYGYRDSAGRRVALYFSDDPFPMPARPGADASAAALEVHDGVTVLCSRAPHTVLVLSDDAALVEDVAELLDLA